MRKLALCGFGLLLLSGLSAPVAAQSPAPESRPGISAEQRAAARELMEAAGIAGQIQQMATIASHNMAEALARSNGRDLAATLRVIDELILPEMVARLPELTDTVADLWASHFSVEDLRALTEFNRSPLGRRVLALQPVMTAQSTTLGKVWGKRIAEDALAKHGATLRARGFKL